MNPLPSLDTGAGPSSVGGGPHSRPGAVVTSSKRGAHTGKVEAEVGSEPRCSLRPHSPSEPPSPHLQCGRHAETPHTGPGGKGRAGRESARESSLYGHRVLGEWTCAVRLTQNTSLKLMSLVCFLFFFNAATGKFHTRSVAPSWGCGPRRLGTEGTEAAGALGASLPLPGGAPRRGHRRVGTQPGHSQQRTRGAPGRGA